MLLLAQARPDAKEKSLSATEQADPRIQKLRRWFIEVAKSLDPRRLVFLDESGKLKSILTDLSARIQQALDGAIRRAMDLIGSDDAVASFTHCGCGAGRVLGPMKAREG